MIQEEEMSAERKERVLTSLTLPMSYSSSSTVPGYRVASASNDIGGDVIYVASSRLWTPLTSALSLRRFTLHCALMTREGELEEVSISPRGVFNCKLIFAQLSK
jgi:hypothetical protein